MGTRIKVQRGDGAPCVHHEARDAWPQPVLWTCRRIRIREQQQMVSMRWGMLRCENASILTGIPWRPSLRCGMLFLSWDWRVWAWMPEGWSSARRRTDFSPLRARLPWLSAHTGPKHKDEKRVLSTVGMFWLSFSLSLFPFTRSLIPRGSMKPPACLRQRTDSEPIDRMAIMFFESLLKFGKKKKSQSTF